MTPRFSVPARPWPPSAVIFVGIVLFGVGLLGCAQRPAGPQLDPTGLPRSVHSLEETVGSILDACERNALGSAHRALHSVDRQVRSVRRLASVAPLEQGGREAINAVLEKLSAGLTEIDRQLHAPEPTDPEAPIAAAKIEAVRSLLGELRQQLPAPMLAELDELNAAATEREAKLAANRAKAAAEAEAKEKASAAAGGIPAEELIPGVDTPGVDTPDAASQADEDEFIDAGPAETP
ncbi:MAG: hypothetical protein AAFV43_15450 [Planctomycetota bacterium]